MIDFTEEYSFKDIKEAKRKRKIWVIAEQTRVKHQLLREYINLWMRILLQYQEKYVPGGKLIYFDGFSGPGLYWKNEKKRIKCLGSPLIVANVAKSFIKDNRNRKITIICIDKDRDNIMNLNYYLKRFNLNYKQFWRAYWDEFDSSVNDLLDRFEKGAYDNPPMFFFIDPFGYSGFPMSTINRIMGYPKVEVFINFMVYEINRWISERQFENTMLNLFGTDDYNKSTFLDSAEEKYTYLKNLYCEQLKTVGKAKFVMPFRINTPGQVRSAKYYLIHASNNIKALELMKNTMAKSSDKEYGFEAIGIPTNQGNLFENPEKEKLRERILAYIKSNYPGNISYEVLKNWAYEYTNGIDRTIKDELMALENNNIRIERLPKQKSNTVTKGALISYIGG